MKSTRIKTNLFLIGFMGTGKTTIAKNLNRITGNDMLEMDQMIVKRQNMTINDIFKEYGEEYFRDLESNLLTKFTKKNGKIVSCGGGAVLREKNVAEMKKSGLIILLTATPETILKRTKNNHSRPNLEGKKNVAAIAEMMEARREKYETAADIIIKTDDKTTAEICEEILNLL